jgi:DNA (cytosine-5)-methyltransferase 1
LVPDSIYPKARLVPHVQAARSRSLLLRRGSDQGIAARRRAGFHVTGVDIKPQPRYCGDEFHQADALLFPLEGFDFIWASPPCQAFTALRFMPTAKDHPNLIPETRARLVEANIPYCIENVPGAPLGASGYLIMLCGTMFGLQTRDGRAELRRHRLFETSFSIPLRPACQHGARAGGVLTVVGHTPVDNRRGPLQTIAVCGNGSSVGGRRAARGVRARAITITGNTPQTNTDRNRTRETFSIEDARAAMGIDWMTMKTLSQAIPPAYSEWIGRQALDVIGERPQAPPSQY